MRYFHILLLLCCSDWLALMALGDLLVQIVSFWASTAMLIWRRCSWWNESGLNAFGGSGMGVSRKYKFRGADGLKSWSASNRRINEPGTKRVAYPFFIFLLFEWDRQLIIIIPVAVSILPMSSKKRVEEEESRAQHEKIWRATQQRGWLLLWWMVRKDDEKIV